MEKIRVCYASSNEYIEYAGVSLLSLLMNDKNKIVEKVYFLSFGAKNENIILLNNIATNNNVDFESIDANEKMRTIFDKISLDLFEGSYATYARAFISEIITDYDGLLLFIDSDTVVSRSLTPLIESVERKMIDKALAAVIGANQYYVGNREKYLTNGNKAYYQCGIILFNMLIWKDKCCTDLVIAYIRKNGSNYKYADQTIINNSIDDRLIVPLPPKYNYWGHGFRGKRLYYEMSRGNWWSKAEIKEAIEHPVIIHYKGHVLHPWLIDNESSYSDVYDYYRNQSPWKDVPKWSVYYDPEIGAETEKMHVMVNRSKKYLRQSYIKVKLFECLRYIKRRLLGEPI